MLADVFAIRKNVHDRTSPFEEEIEALVGVVGRRGENLPVKTGGLLGQPGKAEAMRDFKCGPLGRSAGYCDVAVFLRSILNKLP